jgi:hypothetical protein
MTVHPAAGRLRRWSQSHTNPTPGVGAVANLDVAELAAVGVGDAQLRAGVGRSLRTTTREPAGQVVRSSMSVISASQAPSRSAPL